MPSFEARAIHGASNLRTWRDGWRVLRTIVRERRALPPCAPRPGKAGARCRTARRRPRGLALRSVDLPVAEVPAMPVERRASRS